MQDIVRTHRAIDEAKLLRHVDLYHAISHNLRVSHTVGVASSVSFNATDCSYHMWLFLLIPIAQLSVIICAYQQVDQWALTEHAMSSVYKAEHKRIKMYSPPDHLLLWNSFLSQPFLLSLPLSLLQTLYLLAESVIAQMAKVNIKITKLCMCCLDKILMLRFYSIWWRGLYCCSKGHRML